MPRACQWPSARSHSAAPDRTSCSPMSSPTTGALTAARRSLRHASRKLLPSSPTAVPRTVLAPMLADRPALKPCHCSVIAVLCFNHVAAQACRRAQWTSAKVQTAVACRAATYFLCPRLYDARLCMRAGSTLRSTPLWSAKLHCPNPRAAAQTAPAAASASAELLRHSGSTLRP